MTAATTAMSAAERKNSAFIRKSLTTIFIALLIDILAFTIILPLFPRLLDHYEKTDGSDETSMFFAILMVIKRFRTAIGGTGSRLDIVLFGGCVGSLFSFLQFISSPLIGSLSDKYGRKNILLLSMIGNALSMLLWIFSQSFMVFVLSRVVGGLTEGNVQMSIAMISDLTTEETRSRGLALVGIAFSLGFTIGPPLGAYFASVDLIELFPSLASYGLNSYSSPALFAFVLIIIETIYMAVALPETLNFKQTSATEQNADTVASNTRSTADKIVTKTNVKKVDIETTEPIVSLSTLSLIHFLYLFFFSGMEFTFTFLTHDRFAFTHAQQGKYLGFIGLMTAMVQGVYVRRFAHRVVSERTIVVQGIFSCSIGLGILGVLAFTEGWLYVGAAFLAFTSGTVVTNLTSLASLAGSNGHRAASARVNVMDESSQQGKVLGKFRSMGQLGRSIGPLVACSAYWVLGSLNVYSLYAACLGVLGFIVMYIVPPGKVTGMAKKQKSA